MAVALTKVFDSRDKVHEGPLDEMIYDCEPGAYATNGVILDLDAAIDAANPGIAYTGEIIGVQVVDNIAGKGYTAQYDAGNNKLKILVPAGTEVPNATDLDAAGVVLRLRVLGKRKLDA